MAALRSALHSYSPCPEGKFRRRAGWSLFLQKNAAEKGETSFRYRLGGEEKSQGEHKGKIIPCYSMHLHRTDCTPAYTASNGRQLLSLAFNGADTKETPSSFQSCPTARNLLRKTAWLQWKKKNPRTIIPHSPLHSRSWSFGLDSSRFSFLEKYDFPRCYHYNTKEKCRRSSFHLILIEGFDFEFVGPRHTGLKWCRFFDFWLIRHSCAIFLKPWLPHAVILYR